MAEVVVALSARYLNGRTSFNVTGGLFAWLIYVGLLGILQPKTPQIFSERRGV
jgi:hypothetical protein